MSEKRYYSKTHEWVLLDNDVAIIGITDYAQNELGDIVFLEVESEVGSELSANESFSNIESVKAVSPINSPVSGEITEINGELVDNPEIINSSPHDDGWIIKLKMSNQLELDTLMNESDYSKYLSEQE